MGRYGPCDLMRFTGTVIRWELDSPCILADDLESLVKNPSTNTHAWQVVLAVVQSKHRSFEGVSRAPRIEPGIRHDVKGFVGALGRVIRNLRLPTPVDQVPTESDWSQGIVGP